MGNEYLDVLKVVHEERVAVADFLMALVKFNLVKKEEATSISYSYSNMLDDAVRLGGIKYWTDSQGAIRFKVRMKDFRMWEK